MVDAKDDAGAAQSLRALGVSESEERVYRWLLAHPSVKVSELARAHDLSAAKAQRLLDAIERKGLATHTPERPRRYIPASPEIAIEALARDRRGAIDQALGTIPELRKQAARSSDNGEQVVELISNREAQRQIFEQLSASAEKEVLTMMRLPILVTKLNVPRAEDHPTENEALARGVRYRSLVDAELLEKSGVLPAVREDIKSGEDVRVVSHLPIKMVLADRRMAIIPLRLGQPDSPSLLVRSSALLDALYGLFEILWERASPISIVEDNEFEFDSMESSQPGEIEDLVAMLAAGLHDKAIVGELGVSQRTLLRRVSGLMEHLGARTRFQAGWLAALQLSGTGRVKEQQ